MGSMSVDAQNNNKAVAKMPSFVPSASTFNYIGAEASAIRSSLISGSGHLSSLLDFA